MGLSNTISTFYFFKTNKKHHSSPKFHILIRNTSQTNKTHKTIPKGHENIKESFSLLPFPSKKIILWEHLHTRWHMMVIRITKWNWESQWNVLIRISISRHNCHHLSKSFVCYKSHNVTIGGPWSTGIRKPGKLSTRIDQSSQE